MNVWIVSSIVIIPNHSHYIYLLIIHVQICYHFSLGYNKEIYFTSKGLIRKILPHKRQKFNERRCYHLNGEDVSKSFFKGKILCYLIDLIYKNTVHKFNRDKLWNYLSDFDQISSLSVTWSNFKYRIDFTSIINLNICCRILDVYTTYTL